MNPYSLPRVTCWATTLSCEYLYVILVGLFEEDLIIIGIRLNRQTSEEEYYMALPYYLMGKLNVNEIFNRLIQFERNQDGVS